MQLKSDPTKLNSIPLDFNSIQANAGKFIGGRSHFIQFKPHNVFQQLNSSYVSSIPWTSQSQIKPICYNSILTQVIPVQFQFNRIHSKSDSIIIRFQSMQFNSVQNQSNSTQLDVYNSFHFKSIRIKSIQFNSIQFNPKPIQTIPDSLQFKAFECHSIQFRFN